MSLTRNKLPVGIERFEEIRTEGFYYIDKTEFIRELLLSWKKVNLFTRPRRFGKTLTMDMLKSFFEIGTDPKIFQGLSILKEEELCEKYMGRFPVITISFKNVDADSFESALKKMAISIRREARRFQFLLDSPKLTDIEKKSLSPLFEQEIGKEVQQESLLILSEMLYKHYGRQVILLIDEYDVPLEKSYAEGYYDKMSDHIRSTFQMALKTNEFLYFAVVTGCMRISKESIFSGLNNFTAHSMSDSGFDSCFGFTDGEVRTFLKDYGLEDKYEEVRLWYSGYRFGKEEVYCSWDVLNYVKDHLEDRALEPKSYWANSSGNGLVRDMLEESDGSVRGQMELLMSGKAVEAEIIQELTYNDLDVKSRAERMKYFWSMLYTAGYLTEKGALGNGVYRLAIPNREVYYIFERQIIAWTERQIFDDKNGTKLLAAAVSAGDAQSVQEQLGKYLRKFIFIENYGDGGREGYCRALLEAALKVNTNWRVRQGKKGRREQILVEDLENRQAYVFHIMYADEGLGRRSREELALMSDEDYGKMFSDTGIKSVQVYAAACGKKECRVRSDKVRLKKRRKSLTEVLAEKSVQEETAEEAESILEDQTEEEVNFADEEAGESEEIAEEEATEEAESILEDQPEEEVNFADEEAGEPEEIAEEEATEEAETVSENQPEEEVNFAGEEAGESEEIAEEEIAEETVEETAAVSEDQPEEKVNFADEEAGESEEETAEDSVAETVEETTEEAVTSAEDDPEDDYEGESKVKDRGSRIRLIIAIVLFAVSGGLLILASAVPSFADTYARTIYPIYSVAIGSVTGLLPLSVAELCIYLFLIFIVLLLFKKPLKRLLLRLNIRRLMRRMYGARYWQEENEPKGNPIFRGFSWVALVLSILSLLFALGCGINYHRISFAEEARIETGTYTTEDLKLVCSMLADEVNRRADSVSRDKSGVMRISAMEGTSAVTVMKSLGEEYPSLSGYYPVPKKVLASEILSYQGLSGVYSPFTVEANYNGDMTPYVIPFSACHELAHLKGFMQEDEANFIAYLACIGARREDFAYSGYMMGMAYCMSDLHRADEEAWKEISATLEPTVQEDLKANREFWAKYDGRVSEWSDKVNDAYLKANGQKEGVLSYSRVVDLIIAVSLDK